MQKTIKLNTGQAMPVLGLGTWKSKPNEVEHAVTYALTEAGYTHIDCAPIYLNEKEVGRAFATAFTTIPRESVFITSKLWNTQHKAQDVEPACRQTLADLQLDYLDLYLMHWGVAFQSGDNPKPVDEQGHAILADTPVKETWVAMEALVQKGLVKSIGVANFTKSQLDSLLSYAQILPAVNQVEMHPYNSQLDLLKFCQKKTITVTAYSPLGRLGVSTYDIPRLHEDPLVIQLSQKYHKSIAQILINWAICRGTVAIPKSVTKDRIKENIESLNFTLTKDDVNLLDTINKNLRYVDPKDDWGYDYFKYET